MTTPADLLRDNVVLTVGQAAVVLGYDDQRDQGRRIVRNLIRDRKLALVDPAQSVTRWRIAVAELERYINTKRPIRVSTRDDPPVVELPRRVS